MGQGINIHRQRGGPILQSAPSEGIKEGNGFDPQKFRLPLILLMTAIATVTGCTQRGDTKDPALRPVAEEKMDILISEELLGFARDFERRLEAHKGNILALTLEHNLNEIEDRLRNDPYLQQLMERDPQFAGRFEKAVQRLKAIFSHPNENPYEVFLQELFQSQSAEQIADFERRFPNLFVQESSGGGRKLLKVEGIVSLWIVQQIRMRFPTVEDFTHKENATIGFATTQLLVALSRKHIEDVRISASTPAWLQRGVQEVKVSSGIFHIDLREVEGSVLLMDQRFDAFGRALLDADEFLRSQVPPHASHYSPSEQRSNERLQRAVDRFSFRLNHLVKTLYLHLININSFKDKDAAYSYVLRQYRDVLDLISHISFPLEFSIEFPKSKRDILVQSIAALMQQSLMDIPDFREWLQKRAVDEELAMWGC